jgi:uncharacterized membrane protein YfcA
MQHERGLGFDLKWAAAVFIGAFIGFLVFARDQPSVLVGVLIGIVAVVLVRVLLRRLTRAPHA